MGRDGVVRGEEWDVGMGKGNAPQSPRCGEEWDVGMPHPPSPEKKIGAPSNYPGARLLIPPPSRPKSNPDMRNSKLAHTQAGF